MTGTVEMFLNKVVPLFIAVGKFHVSSKTALMIIKSQSEFRRGRLNILDAAYFTTHQIDNIIRITV